MILQMTEVGPLIMQLYDKTEYVYPIGAKAAGWCLALSSVMMVPIIAMKTLCQLPGSFSQVSGIHPLLFLIENFKHIFFPHVEIFLGSLYQQRFTKNFVCFFEGRWTPNLIIIIHIFCHEQKLSSAESALLREP